MANPTETPKKTKKHHHHKQEKHRRGDHAKSSHQHEYRLEEGGTSASEITPETRVVGIVLEESSSTLDVTDTDISADLSLTPVSRSQTKKSSSHSTTSTSSKSTPNRSNFRMGYKCLIFPKVTPLDWSSFIFLTIACFTPAAVYIALFTQMGIGFRTFFYLSDNFSQYKSQLALGIIAFATFLYLCDMDCWNSKCGSLLRNICSFAIFIAITIWSLFIAGEKTQSPMALFCLWIPLWLILLRKIMFPRKEFRLYISQLTGPLLLTGLLSIGLFLYWVYSNPNNRYNDITQYFYAQESGCVPEFIHEDSGKDLSHCNLNAITNATSSTAVCFTVADWTIHFSEGCSEECLQVFDNCSDTFIIWMGPIVVGLIYFFFALFASFIHSDSPAKDISNFLKVWTVLMLVFWVIVSLNGASNKITETLILLTLTAFVGSTLFFLANYTRDELKQEEKDLLHKFVEKYAKYMDIFKGFVLITTLPVIVLYSILSFINQTVRRFGFPCSKELEPPHSGFFTKKTTKQYHVMKTWDIVKVITYAIYWGIGYMTVQVIAAQFMVLILGVLMDYIKTQGFHVGIVTAVMVAVGVVLFLLPPVPGVPIYMALGIVIPQVGQDIFGGLVGSYFYCVGVSLVLKLAACTMQQKLIGERMAGSVSVRKTVGINTNLVRATRVILSDKGLTIGKVAVLVGGPDWPTSVLAGILKLNLIPILIGTLPVIFLIMPTVLSGLFLYMQSIIDPETGFTMYPWAQTAYVMTFSVTAIVQLGALVIAGIYIEKALRERAEEIEQCPIDDEVQQLEVAEQELKAAYKEATKWSNVPLWAKFILLLALVTMVASCYIVTLFLAESFAQFELNDSIEDKLGGKWTNFVKPLGSLSLLLFLGSTVLWYGFEKWAQYMANKSLRIRPEPNLNRA